MFCVAKIVILIYMLVQKIIRYALIFSFLLPTFSYGQEAVIVEDIETFSKAKVVEVTQEGRDTIPGTTISSNNQTLQVEVLDGREKGSIITFENDHIQLKKGDVFFIRHQIHTSDGSEYWSVSDPYRLPVVTGLLIVFILLLFLFGGLQGVRGLASLIGSLFLIFYVLLPGIYTGYNAIFVSIGVSSLIIILGSYITHGYNRATTSAVLGMVLTVVITGILAYYAVYAAKLSGYTHDESVFLNLNTNGSIDLIGLLFGGIIIGLLGVLYDIAIGQAIAIEELVRAGKHLTRKEIYMRGIRIGREHIGALVNTLAIAYVGASLPLMLLLQSSTVGPLFILNSEIFATEIIRILIGSSGLVLAVPITTLLATYMLYGKVNDIQDRSNHRHHHH